jgi:hypothetical protein
MGDDGEERFDEAFQAFKVPNVNLSNGKQGTRITELVDQEGLEEKYKNREKERKEFEGQGIEKTYITPEYIREFQFDVEPIEGSTVKETQDVEQALFLQWTQQAMALFPDMMNREALFEEFMLKFKLDPRKFKAMMPQPGMMPGAPGSAPGGGIAGQITQRQSGGRQIGAKPSLNQMN